MPFDPNRAWVLFMSDPVTFLVMFGAVIAAVAIGAWWLRGHLAKGRIEALAERLNLARDEQGTLTRQVDRLKAEMAEHLDHIEKLKTYRFSVPEIANLTHSSSNVAQTVTDLSSANSALGTTLTVIDTHGKYQVIIEPSPKVTKR